MHGHIPALQVNPELLRKGILPAEQLESVVSVVEREIVAAGFDIVNRVDSPITGAKGNVELLLHLRP